VVALAGALLVMLISSAAAQPPSAPPPPPPGDFAEVDALFEHAIEALVRGDLATAQRELAEVARRSVDPRRRAAASELVAYLARRSARPASRATHTGTVAGDQVTDPESGRATLLTTSALVGLNYGWMVPLALDISDEKAFVGLYLLTASASFVVPYLITRDDDITRGMSTLGGFGATLGVGHGALIYGTIAGEDGFDSDAGLRGMLGVMIGTSIVEGALGYKWAKDTRMPAGNALAITSGSLYGAGFAFGANVLAQSADGNFRVILGSLLAGSAAGALGGVVYADNRRLSEGDASVVGFTGMVGTYVALAPLLVAEVDNDRAIAGGLMAGAAAGLFAGDYLIRDVDYGRSEAGLVTLGTLAGGLLGAGGAFLATPDDADDAKWIVSGSAAGAVGGLLIMLKAVEPRPESAASDPAIDIAPSATVGMDGRPGFGVAGTF
jgi:hypothetical protein